MYKHTVIALLAVVSAAEAYIIQHINPYSHDLAHGKVFLHGKVLVPYPAYFGHVPFGHHPHFVRTRVFIIGHGHHPAGKPSVPGAIPGQHPGNVPVYPPHFPGVPGVIPDSGPGISIPPPAGPMPDGGPDGGPGVPFPPSPECTVCNVGGGNGGGGPKGNGGPLPVPDEGGREDEGPMPGGETPRAGVPPAGDGEPKPEEPAPETPKPEEPAPETPKPEEPVPETTPKPEEPAPEPPATEEPKPEEPAPEEPMPEEEQKPEREEPKPDEEKSSEEDGAQTTEQDPSIVEPPPARLLLPKKATSVGKNRKGAATSTRRKPGIPTLPLRVVPVLNFHRGMPYIQPLLASPAHFEKRKQDLTAQEGRYAFEYFLPAHGPLVPYATGVIQRPVKALVRLQG